MLLKQMMLDGPDSQVSEGLKQLIRDKWNDTPTAIQVLEALDYAIYGSDASEFVVTLWQSLLPNMLKEEGITYDQLVTQAHWREGQQ